MVYNYLIHQLIFLNMNDLYGPVHADMLGMYSENFNVELCSSLVDIGRILVYM